MREKVNYLYKENNNKCTCNKNLDMAYSYDGIEDSKGPKNYSTYLDRLSTLTYSEFQYIFCTIVEDDIENLHKIDIKLRESILNKLKSFEKIIE
jgi:hypothetical protein